MNAPVNPAMLTLTPTAEQHLLAQMRCGNTQAIGILLTVQSKGCSGLSYALERLEQAYPEPVYQQRFHSGLTLFLALDSLAYLSGLIIDYVQTGLNWKLTFTNPQATQTCGCGESFSVNPDI